MKTIDKPEQSEPISKTGAAANRRPKENARRIGRKAGLWLFCGLIIAPMIVGILVAARSFQFQGLAVETERMTVPTVEVVHPQPGPSETEVTLPGNLSPYSEASLYARTDGYLKVWYADLGAKVNEGQLMAEISAPDVDAQLNQSKANLANAQANLEIARLNFQRQQDLLAKAVSSQQEFDQQRANFESASAAVKAAQADVQNFTVQQNFQKIAAPFSGVVTQRSVDVGDLVTAGANATMNAGNELFRLARTDVLRVFINLPQIYSPAVSQGTKAYLQLMEFPGEKFEGHITNISGAIDPSTRTLLTEVQVPNPDGRLFPGAYAQVHLILPVNPGIIVPANALIFRQGGLQAGVVDASGIVHLRKIAIGRDLGTDVEVVEGIALGERLVANPSDSLADGARVQTKQQQQQAAR